MASYTELLSPEAVAELDRLGDAVTITTEEVVRYSRTITRASLIAMVEQAGPTWVRDDDDDLAAVVRNALNGTDSWEWLAKHSDTYDSVTTLVPGEAWCAETWE